MADNTSKDRADFGGALGGGGGGGGPPECFERADDAVGNDN